MISSVGFAANYTTKHSSAYEVSKPFINNIIIYQTVADHPWLLLPLTPQPNEPVIVKEHTPSLLEMATIFNDKLQLWFQQSSDKLNEVINKKYCV
jgi:hypothetical protein